MLQESETGSDRLQPMAVLREPPKTKLAARGVADSQG